MPTESLHPRPPRLLETTLTFTPKTYDIDFAGHVSNIVYVRWLEDLRVACITAYYPLARQTKEGIGPILSRTEIEYKRPVFLLETVIGRMWVTGMGSVKIVLNAEFEVNGHIVSTAQQTGCFVSLTSGRPVRVPDDFARQYTEAQAEYKASSDRAAGAGDSIDITANPTAEAGA